MLEAFFGSILKARKEHLGGRAHALLHILATRPEHHRRGVGAMHLKHGLAQADELSLPAWLEGSPKGRPLYQRYGFEVVADLEFDAAAFGAKDDLQHVLMLRPAKEKS
jgi:GNAT superfamily N-acetyltransferase